MTLTFDLKGHCELWPKYIKNSSLGTSNPRRWNSRVATPYLWCQDFNGKMTSEVKGQGHAQNGR